MCVYACVWLSLSNSSATSIMWLRSILSEGDLSLSLTTYIYIYIYMWVCECVCVYVCMCVWECVKYSFWWSIWVNKNEISIETVVFVQLNHFSTHIFLDFGGFSICYLFFHMYIYIYIYIYIYGSRSVCVCVCAYLYPTPLLRAAYDIRSILSRGQLVWIQCCPGFKQTASCRLKNPISHTIYL